MGLLNISRQLQIKALEEPSIVKGRECSKKFVQQGRSPFDARSVLIVREHGKMARTPLAAFFNIPFYHRGLSLSREYTILDLLRSAQVQTYVLRSGEPCVEMVETGLMT